MISSDRGLTPEYMLELYEWIINISFIINYKADNIYVNMVNNSVPSAPSLCTCFKVLKRLNP